jgi:hypothetical protein
MQCLIDADVIRYECGFAAETGWKALTGREEIPPFSYVEEILVNRINQINAECFATEPPKLYLTGKGNFRLDVAKKKEYKGNRADLHKPWHYNNITGYLMCMYDTELVQGMEADDAMCIEQTARLDKLDSIICTRDKDLRQCPGMHYGWELGNQPSFGPEEVDEIGYLKYDEKKKTLKGVGSKFFFSQMITGDTTDNIPGLPKKGPAAAYKLLSELNTYAHMEQAVVNEYRAFYGDSWKEEFMEQAYLLWMVRELDEEGKPVMFKLRGEYN